jgi:hypothetical protein
MTEVLTPDESAAMAAMAEDTAPVEAPEPVDAPEAAQSAPAPVEAVTAPVEAAADPEKPPPGFVPQGALHQERERRKETERQLQEFQRELADIKAKLNPPAEIVIPDPILDPKGFREFQIKQIAERAQEKAEAAQKQQQESQQRQFVDRLSHDVLQFKGHKPDFDAAFKHAVEVRQKELAFYGHPQEVIAQQLETDLKALADLAYQQGRNPGELYYEYATMRGYQGAAPAVPQQTQAAAQVNALAQAQKQTATMATAGGPSNDGGVTIETLSKMSEAQLAKMPKAERDEMMRKVMGG